MSRKRDYHLPARPPSYVCRETGSAELEISLDTWDAWVASGRLPPAAPGFPDNVPRWRWADVDARMSGKGSTATDPFVLRAANFGANAPEKNSGRQSA